MVDMPPNQTKSYIFSIYVLRGFDIEITFNGWYAKIPIKENHIYWIYMYKEDLALKTDNGWYTIKPNQTKSYIFNIYV